MPGGLKVLSLGPGMGEQDGNRDSALMMANGEDNAVGTLDSESQAKMAYGWRTRWTCKTDFGCGPDRGDKRGEEGMT
jgi:hypothetical protein